MAENYLPHLSGRAVHAAQAHYYGRAQNESAEKPASDRLSADEAAFIAQRDSFYLSSVTESGWPYIQHRGGPAGFLHVLDPQHLAFADVRGNRQMLTTGNVAVNDRVSLFLMDYPRRERLKILGHAKVLDAREHPELVAQLASEELHELTERIVLIEVVSFDWNCPKYITPRYTLKEVEEATKGLRDRIQELESELRKKQVA